MGNKSENSDEEAAPMTKDQLERAKRASIRSINAAKCDAIAALAENPSTKMIQMVNTHITIWAKLLRELKTIDDQLCDLIDSQKMTSDALIKAEIEITKEYQTLFSAYSKTRGELAGIAACFDKQEKKAQAGDRQSLNNSFTIDGQLLTPVAKLPDIPLPKFDGKLKNFTEWYSLFESMVHSSTMHEVSKLHYLKGAMVGGEAEDLIKHYPLTEGMYAEAHQTVVDRYFNKRAIISEYFRDLLDLPIITMSTLRKSVDKVQAIVRGLNVCGMDTAKLSPLITFIVCRKLPEKVREDWETSNNDYSTYPSFDPLAKYLNNRCFALETYTSAESVRKSEPLKNAKPTKPTMPKTSSNPRNHATALPISNTNSSTSANAPNAASNSSNAYMPARKCIECSGEHYLSYCPSFLSKSVEERVALVRNKALCSNCFRPNHSAKVCRRSNCRNCGEKHNTLLHEEAKTQPLDAATSSNNAENANQRFTGVTSGFASASVVLLPTAVVNVHIGNKSVPARALIDSCSQVNLVVESFVERHKLQKSSSSTNIYGVSQSPIKTGFTVPLVVASRYNHYQLDLSANVITRIPYQVDSAAIAKITTQTADLELADSGLSSSNVDILIGAEYYSQIMVGNKRFVSDLCLEQSQFGWIAIGSYGLNKNPVCCITTTDSDNILEKFWEVEEITPPKIEPSERDICDAHFDQTHSRLPDGRFQVRLPFKTTTKYANTYQQARSALLRFEKTADETLRKMYVEFMQEYRELGHMQLVQSDAQATDRYYIPHLPVWRPESSTTKLRVVFNASADNQHGPSLNKTLRPGYSLQPELFDQLLKFRTYLTSIVGDISKMYRQIQMHPDDRRHQTILWRDSANEVIRSYELCTLTYGTSPASYIAQKCLQKIGRELAARVEIQKNGDSETAALWMEVVAAISSEFYMDDLLSGANSIETAIKKTRFIHKTLEAAQFPMRKYVSNSTELLTSLDPSLVEKIRPIEFSSSGAAKILGLRYLPQEDLFRIDPKLQQINVPITKRVASSKIASVYDPLGLAMPVTIRGKIILQDLWREGLNWDAAIPDHLRKQFNDYYNDLSNLNRFNVPRRYSNIPRNSFDLIGFCDASQSAYAAVVYMKSYTNQGTEVMLVCSKSKVAPLKTTTIPRLELLGAVLLTKLIARVAKTLKYEPSNAFVFSDSTIVLSWLKGPASKYEVFVRNRIAFVTATLPFERWSYVRSAENPADLATRGVSVSALAKSELWLRGPALLNNEIKPSIEVTLPEPPEIRKNSPVTLIISQSFDESIITRFSQFGRMVRVIIIVQTFIKRCRGRNKLAPYVSEKEARNSIYRASQLAWFKSEIDSLRKKQPLPKRCPLASINPFIDESGILRVGGRLQNSSLSYNTKHPIILHRKSYLTKLLVQHAHHDYYHSSLTFMTGFLQTQWWIPGTPSLVKDAVKKCAWCTRMRAETVGQIMGNLPAERTEPGRPFTNASVDFAGPFTIKCTNHRTMRYYKYYAAFFVCLVTRAVHIEAVSDLSTPAFIKSLRRFVARRGRPLTIWSDNATNFVGARNLLEKYDSNIVWKFIPPRSPHHGGIWESAVKAGKKYLLAITKGLVLTEEDFKTALHDIEAVLNSRPMYRRSGIVNPDAIDILTPGHFLIGSHLLNIPDNNTRECNSLYDLLDAQSTILRNFWTQWKRSYLSILQTRSKWKTKSPNLEIGDVVLLKEESPPFSWPLGLIISGTPDAEGHLRVVRIRSKGSEYIRAVQKLVKLPIEKPPSNSDNDNSNN